MKLLHLPSVDGEEYDMYALIPDAMKGSAAKQRVNKLIAEANAQDRKNHGGCDDGSTVGEYIVKVLKREGFVFLVQRDMLETDYWDQ